MPSKRGKKRPPQKEDEREARRAKVQAEAESRTCTCPPWAEHTAECLEKQAKAKQEQTPPESDNRYQ